VLQLTGFSDPVYAEAYVTVHQYDIVMDVTVVNRSKEIQQNLCLELATMGDLKLVERPQVRVGAYTKSCLPVLPKLVTVQTDYPDCCPYIVQYIAMHKTDTFFLPSQNYTLDVGETKHVRANIKVSSTETGVIFGNIVYESSGSDRNVVVLNDIHIDIMDYIAPATCHGASCLSCFFFSSRLVSCFSNPFSFTAPDAAPLYV
jgi:coatomer subunit beta